MAIDFMAQRYHKLPTEILREATTADFAIMDAVLTVQKIREKQGGDLNSVYDQEQLRKIHGKG